MSPTRRLGRSWRLGRNGLAFVEFALATPMLLLLVLGMSDLVLQMRTVYRVERMAGEILNAAAQLDPVTSDQLSAILAAASSIGGSAIPVGDTPDLDGAVHITAVANDGAGGNTRLWTRSNHADAPAAVQSRLGAKPALPGGAVVPPGAQLLVVEVLSQRRRWTSAVTQVLTGGSQPSVIYAVAVAQPRSATLSASLPP